MHLSGGLKSTPLWCQSAFGSSLKQLASAGHPPHVLHDCLRFLAARGLTIPLLFSSPVNKRLVLALKESYDAGRRILRSAKAANSLDPVAVANLLLLWLGSLPEPLFPSEHLCSLLEGPAIDEGAIRTDRVAALRFLLKRTEPFIIEALFPLFEMLHHYWINQPEREETLQELSEAFAGPVFGVPSEYGLSAETGQCLVRATALLIMEYRPLFTQPYNLQRYQADLARQAAAAEAQAATKAQREQEVQCRREHWEQNLRSPEDLSPTGGSPLLTPRRLDSLTVVGLQDPFAPTPNSPNIGSPFWSEFQAMMAAASEKAETPSFTAEQYKDDGFGALLDRMLECTLETAFNGTSSHVEVDNSALSKMAITEDQQQSPLSTVLAFDGSDKSTTDGSESVGDLSREVSDCDDIAIDHQELRGLVVAAAAAQTF